MASTVAAMEATAHTIPTSSSKDPPLRVLVQTLTHLVPGSDNFEKCNFVLNLICQKHWNCDFGVPRFRWASYNDLFAFDNLRCFFLVDCGESDDDRNVPVLSYEWTGESLKSLPNLAKNPKIQAKLTTDMPFTVQPRPPREKRPIRSVIKTRLYCKDNIPCSEVQYIRDHPEDQQWLKAHVKPRIWREFRALANNTKSFGAPDIEE